MQIFLNRALPAPILINMALPHEGKEDIFGYILRLMLSKFLCPLYPSTLSGTPNFPNIENVNQMPAHFSHRANNCCFHSNCRMDTNKEQDIGISIFFYRYISLNRSFFQTSQIIIMRNLQHESCFQYCSVSQVRIQIISK